MISALVCGASLRRKATICSGGVRARNSKGRISITAESRPVISAARSGPSARSSTWRAYSTPPSAIELSASEFSLTSSSTRSICSVGISPAFAISSESSSISGSERWPKTSAAFAGPSATSSTAALRRPRSGGTSPPLGTPRREAGTATRSIGTSSFGAGAATLGLLHPGAQLLRDPVGVHRGDLFGAVGQPGVVFLLPVGIAAHFEFGQRGRRVQFAQPQRFGEHVVLFLAQLAAGEEEEAERGQAERRVLGVAGDAGAGGPGDGRRVGEGDAAGGDRVAAFRFDPGGRFERRFGRGDFARRHRFVDDQRDVLLFDRPRRFLRVFDRLVDAELGFVVVAFVVRGPG